MEKVVEILKEKGKTIATMESCTGGGVANAITNIEGASEVFRFGAVTYSNEYKIKMGVNSKIIEEYSVYSIETAMEMSKNISRFANADLGIGITGKINKEDVNNKFGDNNKIFISIYEAEKDKYFNFELKSNSNLDRAENKEIIIKEVTNKLTKVLCGND